tara:strand:- start:360 stop:653 length:294 start_codon:yes stop_codon:yes gene_type:complete
MNPLFHQYQKEVLFISTKKYYQFLNWISGEFDLFLQDETNGLKVYFPEGNFLIKVSTENESVLAHINLSTNAEKKGEDILNKIMLLYKLLLNLEQKH